MSSWLQDLSSDSASRPTEHVYQCVLRYPTFTSTQTHSFNCYVRQKLHSYPLFLLNLAARSNCKFFSSNPTTRWEREWPHPTSNNVGIWCNALLLYMSSTRGLLSWEKTVMRKIWVILIRKSNQPDTENRSNAWSLAVRFPFRLRFRQFCIVPNENILLVYIHVGEVKRDSWNIIPYLTDGLRGGTISPCSPLRDFRATQEIIGIS